MPSASAVAAPVSRQIDRKGRIGMTCSGAGGRSGTRWTRSRQQVEEARHGHGRGPLVSYAGVPAARRAKLTMARAMFAWIRPERPLTSGRKAGAGSRYIV